TDQTGKIVSVNNAFVKITGYDEKDAIGERANILSSGNQDKELFAEMWKQITSKGEWHGEILNKHKIGEEYKQAMSISAIYDASGEVMRYVATLDDMKDKQSVKTTRKMNLKICINDVYTPASKQAFAGVFYFYDK